ncbi:MAG: DUF2931 family protein [Gemmatimonadaceae bacterium]|nr:DUF2931 family protein [Gemmatimonadaceae bacterium]
MPDPVNWIPVVSTPRGFPMIVTAGTLQLADGSEIPISIGGVKHSDWGQGASVELLGSLAKSLPVGLRAEWFSLREDRFFIASLSVPQEEFRRLVSETSFHPKLDPAPSPDRLVIGLAPGGHLALWAAGAASTVFLTSTQGEPQTPEWSSRFPEVTLPRDEFIRINLEELQLQNVGGVATATSDLWQRVEDRQKWKLLTAGIADLEMLSIRFANGEFAYFRAESEVGSSASGSALPHKIELQWRDHNGDRRGARLEFSIEELFAVADQLTGRDSSQQYPLSLSVDLADAPRAVTVTLASASKVVLLQQVRCEYTLLR